jgi:hypothetical protein
MNVCILTFLKLPFKLVLSKDEGSPKKKLGETKERRKPSNATAETE